MDLDTKKRIDELARFYRSMNLAASDSEAQQKAKDIILAMDGKTPKQTPTVQELIQDNKDVEKLESSEQQLQKSTPEPFKEEITTIAQQEGITEAETINIQDALDELHKEITQATQEVEQIHDDFEHIQQATTTTQQLNTTSQQQITPAPASPSSTPQQTLPTPQPTPQPAPVPPAQERPQLTDKEKNMTDLTKLFKFGSK